MFRISIAGILWLVVLAALNFAVLRYFEYIQKSPEPIILLVGLMPLFDGFMISLYVAATRKYHFALRRRDRRGEFAGVFALTTAVMLAVSTFLCIVASQHILELMDSLFSSFIEWLTGFAQQGHTESLVGAALCLIMSGPMLVIATIFAFVMSRYKLVITRRG